MESTSQPIQPTPTPVEKPITPVPTKNNSFLVTLLSLLLLLAVATAGFFAYQTQNLVKQLNEMKIQPTPQPTNLQPTSTPDPTADWEIYTGSSYTFKYPSDWDTTTIGDAASGSLMVAPENEVEKVKQISGGFGGGKFLTMTIRASDSPPDWKTDEYWEVSSVSTLVDGISGTRYTVNVIQDLPGLSKGDITTNLVVKKNNRYFEIDLLDKTYLSIFDQILSTFRFTEQ